MLTSQLAEIQPEIPDAILDIRYATQNNFTGEPLYDEPHALLMPDPLEALKEGARIFRANGLRIVIFDAWRPDDAHDKLKDSCSDPDYVSPTNRHGTGNIVDMALARAGGTYLDMGTDYDHFGPKSEPYYSELDDQVKQHRRILLGVMSFVGYKVHPKEWWDQEYVVR